MSAYEHAFFQTIKIHFYISFKKSYFTLQYVTQFWKTILLGTIVNFSLNEATGSYSICLVLKFQLDILKLSRDIANLLSNTLQTNF